MLCGFLPFDEDSKSLLYKKILNCDYSIPKFVSAQAQDLIKKILVRNIHARYSIEDIKAHPWFKSNLKTPLNRGLSAALGQGVADDRLCHLAASKTKVTEHTVRQMVEENSHNKYTTL